MSRSDNQMSPDVQHAEVLTYFLKDDGAVPNSPLPLLLYPGVLVFDDGDPAAVCEQVFHGNGWGDSWRNGIYSFHHYHSTAHEVLGICGGIAKVQFGGESGVVVEIEQGDVAILPAGVGHKKLGGSSDLLVVGAYPPGSDCDLMRNRSEDHRGALVRIGRVPLPSTDPVYGERGPLLHAWKR